MKELFGSIAFLLSMAGFSASAAPYRPAITGVFHIAVYAANPAASEYFYEHDLGGVKGEDPENRAGVRYYFAPTQFVEVLPLPEGSPTINRLDHVAYVTRDGESMRQYLASQGIAVPDRVSQGFDYSRWFEVVDPEGHTIEFVQPPPRPPKVPFNGLSNHILHIGFIVHNVALEDNCFVTVLGFRDFWAGGLNPEKPTWIWREVPEGRDWVEYMVSGAPDGRGIPPDMTAATAGIMNHYAIGVANVEQAYTLLSNGGRLRAQRNDPMLPPMLGLSGKWEFSLLDPDGTRTEVMELHTVSTPCCSPVTAPEPDE